MVFQDLVENVFEGMVWRELVFYLDDIEVLSKTFDEVFSEVTESI